MSQPIRSSSSYSRLFYTFITSIIISATTIPASAASFLEQLEGDWKGKGTVEENGDTVTKTPLACRLNAKFNKSNNSLHLSGRCGAAAGTTRFQSVLTESANGQISGKPILLRGDLANITLSGKPSGKSLKMSGTKNGEALTSTIFLQAGNKFQSQISRSRGGKQTSFTVIRWSR